MTHVLVAWATRWRSALYDPSQPCLLYHLIGPSKRPDRGELTRPDRAEGHRDDAGL